ncbi:MAG: hypothetical protein AAGB22_08890, partial [Bacteroidota bacterium]
EVTVGVGQDDSLLTTYAYHPDHSIDTITDPNGMVLHYDYDDFGRLEHAFRNGQRVSANHYATWANDTTLSFAARAAQNYVQASLFNNDGDLTAETSRAWLDPMGRAWNTASAVVPDGLSPANPTAMVHSGQAVFDAWNRVTRQYKPFLHTAGGSPVGWTPRLATTDPINYPSAFSTTSYENDQRARPLKEAKPGEDILTGHTVDFGYRFVNALCMLCELGLDDSEIGQLMPELPENWVFEKTTVTDEDGKVSQEYTNPLGQKVASRQLIDPSAGSGQITDAVTLFLYDSQGNLTQVINPEKQPSFYRYNLLGWLYEKETVDGGKTKYLYNRSGQVTLEQDANGAAGEYLGYGADSLSARIYRKYTYDAFGRLVCQERLHGVVHGPGTVPFDPLLYRTDTHNPLDGPHGSAYHMTHNSTYDWKAVVIDTVANGMLVSEVRQPVVGAPFLEVWHPLVEKQWYYGTAFDTTTAASGLPGGSYHANSLGRLTGDRTQLRGRLSHTLAYDDNDWSLPPNSQRPVEAVFHSYNADGELKWQFKQFNPNGIRPEAKGLLTRIDYPAYNTRGSLLEQRVDVHSDQTLDLQYQYLYDGRNRLSQVYLSMDTSKVDTGAGAGSNN